MQTKLTLRMDDSVVDHAKRWAQTRGISLSKAVADFLSTLPDGGEEPELTSWTRRLAGAALHSGVTRPRDEVGEEYLDYLEEKYR